MWRQFRRRLPRRVSLVFDGSCNFCTLAVTALTQLDHGQRITIIPFQASASLAAIALARDEAEAAAWVITPRGNRYRGAAAVALALAVAINARWPMWLYLMPVVSPVADTVYTWVARNRHLIRGMTPYCVKYPDRCDPAPIGAAMPTPAGPRNGDGAS